MDEEILVEMMIEEMQSTPNFFLTDACESGDIREARRLIESGVSFWVDGCWFVVFQKAIQNENTDVLELLIESGLQLSSFHAFTAAIKAADRPEMLEFLLLHGADPQILEDGWSALHYAARYGRRQVLQTLIEQYEFDPMLPNHEGITLLMLAALSSESHKGASPSLDLLLSLNRCHVNAQDRDGRTALMRAAQYGRMRNAEALLRHDAFPGIQDKEGRTALMLAAGGAPPDEILIGTPKTASSPMRLVERELLAVDEMIYPAIVRILISYGAHPALHDAYGSQAIHFAHARGAEDIVSILWAGGGG